MPPGLPLSGRLMTVSQHIPERLLSPDLKKQTRHIWFSRGSLFFYFLCLYQQRVPFYVFLDYFHWVWTCPRPGPPCAVTPPPPLSFQFRLLVDKDPLTSTFITSLCFQLIFGGHEIWQTLSQGLATTSLTATFGRLWSTSSKGFFI